MLLAFLPLFFLPFSYTSHPRLLSSPLQNRTKSFSFSKYGMRLIRTHEHEHEAEDETPTVGFLPSSSLGTFLRRSAHRARVRPRR